MTVHMADPFTCGPWSDATNGVQFRLRSYHDELDALEWRHTCRASDGTLFQAEDSVPLAPCWPDGWKVVSGDPLELSPSLLCRACGTHGFFKGGKWVSV